MAARSSPSPPTSARARSWSRRARKAEMLGIKPENIFIEDLREEFVRDYVFPMFRANALYEGVYLLGTSIARPLIAKTQIEIARGRRRRRRLPRRHRQGQRPGPLRAHLLRAGAGHPDHRALARVELQEPRAADRVRREAPDPRRQGQARRGAVLDGRQPAAHPPTRARCWRTRRSSRRPTSTGAPSRRGGARPGRPRSPSASSGRCGGLDGEPLSPADAARAAQRPRPRQRHRPRRPGREPLRRHEVARRLRDARRHDPARGAPGDRVDHAGPRRRPPQGRADAALCRADLQRLLVLRPSARCCRRPSTRARSTWTARCA